MTEADREPGSCVCCRRRDARWPLVCEPCRDWLPAALAGIVEMYPRLPDVLEPSGDREQRVSGTPERQVPLNLDAEDLLTRVVRLGGIPVDSTPDTMEERVTFTPVTVPWWSPVGHRLWQRHEVVELRRSHVEQPAGDQVGYLPVAQVLDTWMRDWVEQRRRREHRPVPTVPVLVEWLSNRLDWACDHYEAIGDFAASVKTLRGHMMNVLGELDAPPEHCDGVECQRCDRRDLWRVQDGSGDVECRNPDCRKVYRAADYESWVRHTGGYEKSLRTPDEVRGLLHDPCMVVGCDRAGSVRHVPDARMWLPFQVVQPVPPELHLCPGHERVLLGNM